FLFVGSKWCIRTSFSGRADRVSTPLNAQGMMWSTSPAYTEIETRVLDWLAELIQLPHAFRSPGDGGAEGGGVIQGTASEASLVSIIAARERARAAGAPIHRLAAYVSQQAHSSLTKDARIAGVEPAHLRLVPTDGALAMRPDALLELIRADLAAGLTPFYACATVGTTSSGSIDPLRAIGEALAALPARPWLHVDAAYAGAACVCPELRHIIDGVEHADSFNFNPHKWLLTAFDCSALWVKRKADLLDALSIMPEYLRNEASASGAVIDYRDWQIPLGRRFRALKLWWTIRHYGAEGLREHIRRHVRLAEFAERRLLADPRFVAAAPRSLSLLTFRLAGDGPDADRRTRTLMERVNASGEAFFSHTMLPDPATGEARYVIRMAIGGTWTTEEDVRRACDALLARAD
ncbi:MAG: aspartate aminotransferase family protein, partial [Phycisphaerales bacterium]|nr:aspartate aminotransferase family protein [Phycisphaerales bacterium]